MIQSYSGSLSGDSEIAHFKTAETVLSSEFVLHVDFENVILTVVQLFSNNYDNLGGISRYFLNVSPILSIIHSFPSPFKEKYHLFLLPLLPPAPLFPAPRFSG